MAQVNMYLPLVQREKLLIHTHKRLLKIVSVANFISGICDLSQFMNNSSIFCILSAPTISQVARPFQSSSALSESSNIYRPDSSSVLRTPVSSVPLPSWGYNVAPPIGLPRSSSAFFFF